MSGNFSPESTFNPLRGCYCPWAFPKDCLTRKDAREITLKPFSQCQKLETSRLDDVRFTAAAPDRVGRALGVDLWAIR